MTNKSTLQTLGRVRGGGTPPPRAFMEKGIDFVVKDRLPGLVRGMRVSALFSAAQEAGSKVAGAKPYRVRPRPCLVSHSAFGSWPAHRTKLF